MQPSSSHAHEQTHAPKKSGLTWEEQSGFLDFLASVQGNVDRMNAEMDMDLRYEIAPPESIDKDAAKAAHAGFVVTRRNRIFPEKTYCLYSIFREGALYGYVGLFEAGRIETIRQLKPIESFTGGADKALYDWLRELLHASVEKL